MIYLLCIILLPCVLGAETLCSDGNACPKGTYCCTTFDGRIRCCDAEDSTASAVRSTKTLKVTPSEQPYLFSNSSVPGTLNAYCFRDESCNSNRLFRCCEGTCCPYLLGTCCKTGCCRSNYECCGDASIGEIEWCCGSGKKCSTYVKGLCISGATSLIPLLILPLSLLAFCIQISYVFTF